VEANEFEIFTFLIAQPLSTCGPFVILIYYTIILVDRSDADMSICKMEV